MTVIELCVEDTEGVQIASQMGIDRVELCDDLSCGGLTPSDRVVDSALSVAPSGGMQVLIRPRPGTFVMPSGEERDIAEAMRRLRERSNDSEATERNQTLRHRADPTWGPPQQPSDD